MPNELTESYLKALKLVNLAHLSKESGRAYRTLQAYRNGYRRVTEKAAEELVAYLKRRTESLSAAAARLEAALPEEGADG